MIFKPAWIRTIQSLQGIIIQKNLILIFFWLRIKWILSKELCHDHNFLQLAKLYKYILPKFMLLTFKNINWVNFRTFCDPEAPKVDIEKNFIKSSFKPQTISNFCRCIKKWKMVQLFKPEKCVRTGGKILYFLKARFCGC